MTQRIHFRYEFSFRLSFVSHQSQKRQGCAGGLSMALLCRPVRRSYLGPDAQCIRWPEPPLTKGINLSNDSWLSVTLLTGSFHLAGCTPQWHGSNMEPRPVSGETACLQIRPFLQATETAWGASFTSNRSYMLRISRLMVLSLTKRAPAISL